MNGSNDMHVMPALHMALPPLVQFTAQTSKLASPRKDAAASPNRADELTQSF